MESVPDIEESSPEPGRLLKDTHYAVCCCTTENSYALCDCSKADNPSADGPLYVPKGLVSALSAADAPPPAPSQPEGDVSDSECDAASDSSAPTASPPPAAAAVTPEASPALGRAGFMSTSTERVLRTLASDIVAAGDPPRSLSASDSPPNRTARSRADVPREARLASPAAASSALSSAPASVASTDRLASPRVDASNASHPSGSAAPASKAEIESSSPNISRSSAAEPSNAEEAYNLGVLSPPLSRRVSIDAPSLIAAVAANRRLKRVFTRDEVRQHNRSNDCWMIINGCVYDITPYIGYHPGGSRALMKWAGRDGSENVPFHSKEMGRLLKTYFYLGTLEGADSGRRCVIS